MNNSSRNNNAVEPWHCTANLQGFEQLLFVVLNVLSGCLTIFGNIAVLFTVYSSQSLQTVSNFLICSLSIADFLVGVVVNPLYIAIVILKVWVSSHVLYLAENYFWVQSLFVTTFSLAAISVDRYLAITKVFRYEAILTRRRCAVTIFSIWVVSFVFSSITLIIEPEDASKLWVTSNALTICIPFAVIGYSYFYIYQAAQRQSRSITDGSKTDREMIRQNIYNRKAAVSVAIIIGLFLALYTPNFVVSIVEISFEEHCKKMFVYKVWLWINWTAFLSSASNPWVYTLRNRRFRKSLKIIWKRYNYFKSNTVLNDPHVCSTDHN